jgi:hypothetical protein
MLRSPSAVVLASVALLSATPALAQSEPAQERKPAGAPPKAQSTEKPATGKAPAAAGAGERRGEARLSDEAELARVVSLYEAGMYDECSGELERLLDPTGRAPLRQPNIVENARVYWAACLMGGGKPELADAPLRAAIHENPQMKPPDSLVFPQPVVNRFFAVRDSLISEIRAAEQKRIKEAEEQARKQELRRQQDLRRMRELEQLARQELVVIRNHRVLSFVPFGVGQIQNRREALGYTLMVSQVLLGSSTIAAIAVQSHWDREVYEQERQGRKPIAADVNSTFRTWTAVRDVSAWGFLTLAVGGVIHAQLDYQPEYREIRQRLLPARLRSPEPVPAEQRSQSASVSAVPYVTPEGAGVSAWGRF